MIYLAPLQGFTDFVYRGVYDVLFGCVDAYFIPYITTKNKSIMQKYYKEITPGHNLQGRVVPQILADSEAELLLMANHLNKLGYEEVNLNMGCPYPMVTKRGKGSGLLPFPEKVDRILSKYFASSNVKLSIKLRAGLYAPEELEQIVPVLNKYPLKEVILHPRIAKQLYTGEICSEAYALATEKCRLPLVFNGDIFSVDDLYNRKQQFPLTQKWMLGRGILMDPFLPLAIKGENPSEEERRVKLREFHDQMLERYLGIMDNEGNALNKMHQFWIYFSHNFTNTQKVLKAIKKSKSLMKYKQTVQQVFNYWQ